MKKSFFTIALIAMCIPTLWAENQKVLSYHGEFEGGYSIGVGNFASGRINLQTIQGFMMSKYFSAGIGIGIDYYHEDGGDIMVPIFVNFKGYFPVSEKVSPYMSFDIGAGFGATQSVRGLSGMLCSPAIGVRVNRFMCQFGYHMQGLSERGISANMSAIQIKLGATF